MPRPPFWICWFLAALSAAVPVGRAALTAPQVAEALDSGTSIGWTAPAAAWSVVTGPEWSHDGVDGVRTPPLGHGESAELTGQVQGPGTLRGWLRVSSEPLQDILGLKVDGVTAARWSGEREQAFEWAIPRGGHEIQLSWKKDADRTGGADAAWLDQVIFSPSVIAAAEALDLAGTPAAGAVTFSTPPGTSAWTGVAVEATAGAQGDDVLFSASRESSGSGPRGLQATVQGPAVVTFRGRFSDAEASDYHDALRITPQGAVQALGEVQAGGWTTWRFLVPDSQGTLLIEHGGRGSSGRSRESGYFLDDWKVTALAPAGVAEALDVPGMTFTMEWTYVNGGPALNPPWVGLAGGAEAGLSRDGVDSLISPKPVVSVPVFNSSGDRKLTTRVTGPGQLSFWWKVVGKSSNGLPYAEVRVSDPAGLETPSVFYPVPSQVEWQQRVLNLPPGVREISWQWRDGWDVLALDQMVWTPASAVVPAPTAAMALDVQGAVAVGTTGSWDVAGWEGAGNGDDDALIWAPMNHPELESTPDARRVRATATGEGLLSFAWQAGRDGLLDFAVDGVGEDLGSGFSVYGPSRGPEAWWQVARRLPAGSHALWWAARGTGFMPGNGEGRLDGLSHLAVAPAWVDALDGAGITDWQMGGSAWAVVTGGAAHDGSDALRTPVLGAHESAGIGARVMGPGTVRFRWKLDDSDPLPPVSGTPQRNTFTLSGWDNNLNLKLDALGSWQEGTVELPQTRPYQLNWEFQRSNRATLPGDAAWLDAVSYAPAVPVTVGEAMDAPHLTWTSSGVVQPLGGGGLGAATGADLVRLPLDQNFPPVPAWIQTTVPGPGLISLRAGNGPWQFRVDGIVVPVFTGDDRLWFQARGAGPHVCRLELYDRSPDYDLDEFRFMPLNLTTPEAALDEPAVTRLNLQGLPSGNHYGVADAAASHDGVDVLRMEGFAPAYNSSGLLTARFNGPALVRFWWRGEGAPTGRGIVSLVYDSEVRTGPFDWVEKRILVTAPGESELTLSAREGEGSSYRLWVDEFKVEPLVAAPLAEALHAGALTFATGGSAPWQGLRPPGVPAGGTAADGAYGLVNIPAQSTAAAWLETMVTGPGKLSYEATFDTSWTELAVSLQPQGDPARTLTTGSPLLIPPGVHTVRWAARHRYAPSSGQGPTAQLREVKFVPALSLAEGFDQPAISFTALPSTGGGFWYGSLKTPQDPAAFTGDDVVQLSGTADFSFPLTGPGWLTYEAWFPTRPIFGYWPPDTSIALFLLPPPPDPGAEPWPFPAAKTLYYAGVSGGPQWEKAWIPPGSWKAVFRGINAGTLNRLLFTPLPPALTPSAAAGALDLGPGLTLTLPSGVAGAAPVSRDGEDALQVVISNFELSPEPLVGLGLEGPALLTGWLRTAKAELDDPAAVPGVDSDPGFNEVRILVDGAPVAIAWASPQAGGWVPLRLPVTGTGAHTVTFAMAAPFSGSRHLLQLDGFSLNPLTPVPLAEALDTPGLAWTSVGTAEWQGFASLLASPDGVDGAWITVPAVTAVPPAVDAPSWLETTVTGPGSLTLTSHGSGLLKVIQGSQTTGTLVNSYGHAEADNWQKATLLIGPGPQTIRIVPQPAAGTGSVFGVDQVDWQPGSVATLAEALDAPGLTFTTTGVEAASWQGLAVPAMAHDGVDAMIFRATPTQLTTLETTVEGPAVVSFLSSVGYGAVTTFTVDGQPVRPEPVLIGGGVIGVDGAAAPAPPEVSPWPLAYDYWQREEFILPAGSHVLRWTLEPGSVVSPWPDAPPLGLDELRVLPLTGGPLLAEAIDQPGWSVTTNLPDKVRSVTLSPDAWYPDDAVLLTGNPDEPGAYQPETWPALTAVVPGPGILRYRWRSLGGSYGGARAAAPGGALASSDGSGAGPWNDGWIVLPYQGPSSVVWRVSGLNHGYWVDAVTFEPGLPPGPATGAPGLPWTTGGNTSWLGIPALSTGYQEIPAYAAVAASGPADSWLETTVTGPGRLKFTAEFTRPSDWNGSGLVSFDGQVLKSVEAVDNYQPGRDFTLVVPAGPHTVRWSLMSGSSPPSATGVPAVLRLRRVSYTPSAAVDPIAEALDAPALPWLIPGDAAGWELQTASTTDGVDALRFTPPVLYGNSSLTTVLPEPCEASFKVRAQGNRTISAYQVTAQAAWSDVAIHFDTPQPQIVTLPVTGSYNNTEPPHLVELDRFSYTPVPVSLGEALDAPGQVWETSGANPFIGFASTWGGVAYDRVDAVMARDGKAGAWLRTSLSGPVRVSFRQWQTGGRFTLDGAVLTTPQSTGWNWVSFETGPGLHELRWEKSGDEGWAIDTFRALTLAPGTALAEALDFPGVWRLTEPAVPAVSLTDTSDGEDAVLLSGADGRIGVEVTGPGRLEFRSKAPPVANQLPGQIPLLEAGSRVVRAGPPVWGTSANEGLSVWNGIHTQAWGPQSIDTIPPGRQMILWPAGSFNFGTGETVGLDQVGFVPYAATTLASGLDALSLAFATESGTPWTGWQAGSASYDGQDVVISGGLKDSWMDLTLPAGAGEIRLMVRCPSRASSDAPGLRMTQGDTVRAWAVPEDWKQLVLPFSATGPRTLRLSQTKPGDLWLDALSYVAASDLFNEWLAAHGLPDGTAADSDADGDGLPALLEYAFGLDATRNGQLDMGLPDGAGLPVFEFKENYQSWSGGRYLECRYLRRTGGRGLQYEALFTHDPGEPLIFASRGDSSWITPLTNDWELVTVRDYTFSGGTAKRFGRVRVVLER